MQPLNLTIAQALQQAIAHQKAGRVQEAEKLYRAILHAQPRHPDANHNIGILAIQMDKVDQALPFLKTALEVNAEVGQYWLSFIDALIKAGNHESARQVLKQGKERGLAGVEVDRLAHQLGVGSSQSQSASDLAPAVKLRESGRYQQAVLWLEDWISTHGNDPEALAHLAHVHLLLNGEEAAQEKLNQAVLIAPDIPVVQRNIARLYLKQKKIADALAAAFKVYQMEPQHYENRLVLVSALVLSGQDTKAMELIEEIIRDKDDCAEAYFNRALLKMREKNIKEALTDCNKAISLKSHMSQFWVISATLHHQDNNLPQAISSLEQALILEPENTTYMIILGEYKRQSDDVEGALALLTKAVEREPGNATAWTNYGVVLQQAERQDEAKRAYKKVLELSPDVAEVHNNLGIMAINDSNWEEALQCFEKAVSLVPQRVDFLKNKGAAYKKLGRTNEFIDTCTKALYIQPDSMETHRSLGMAFKEIGQNKKALTHFKEALKLLPEAPGDLIKIGNALCEEEKSYAVNHPINKQAKSNMGALCVAESDPESALTEAEWLNEIIKGKEAIERGEVKEYYSTERMLNKYSQKKDSSSGNEYLRILLFQPPIWKIAEPGTEPFSPESGGPPADQEFIQKIDTDSISASYGLLSIAAQILDTGREVLILNMSNFTWPEVEKIVHYLDGPDLVGISCATYNLKGVRELSKLIRDTHPKTRIVIGGSHPTALPAETLQHFQAVDSVVIGEGELTFIEIIKRLENNLSIQGVAGTVWRNNQNVIQLGPPRERIQDIDSLIPPHDYFPVHMLLTTRGCPFNCTFCGSHSLWGSKVSVNSTEYVLQNLERIAVYKNVKILKVKDETFTATRKRALAICSGIMERKLNFIWSCDARVDTLDEEVLRTMRLAGCQRISLGVESGSPDILKAINKKTSPEKVINATRMARKFGFQIRFYMMAGNRGETPETFLQSLKLIHEAQPNLFSFCYFSILPGTEEFEIYKKEKGATPEFYFDDNYSGGAHGFPDYLSETTQDIIKLWIEGYAKSSGFKFYNIGEYEEILDRLDGLHSAHMDLAGAYMREGLMEPAEYHIRKAMEKNYPLLGVALNSLACIAASRGNMALLYTYLSQAAKTSKDNIITENIKRYRAWIESGESHGGQELRLLVHNSFPIDLDFQQPYLPASIRLP